MKLLNMLYVEEVGQKTETLYSKTEPLGPYIVYLRITSLQLWRILEISGATTGNMIKFLLVARGINSEKLSISI